MNSVAYVRMGLRGSGLQRQKGIVDGVNREFRQLCITSEWRNTGDQHEWSAAVAAAAFEVVRNQAPNQREYLHE